MNIGNSSQTETRQCVNPLTKTCAACGVMFTPEHRHPQQKYCRTAQCLRNRAAARKRKSERQQRKDKDCRKRTSQRKHDEYIRRKAAKTQRAGPFCPEKPRCDPLTPQNMGIYFLGLISYATGTTDAYALNSLREHCYEIGKNICLRK